MKKLITGTLVALLTVLAPTKSFANAAIFSGTDVKILKFNLDFNGRSKILSGTVDPSSSATSANPGSLYLNSSTGLLYVKTDSGSSTNWSLPVYTVGTQTIAGAKTFSNAAVFSSTASFTGAITVTGGIVGSIGTTDATAGNVGEYMESKQTTNTSINASSTYQDLAGGITLTPGDWDVSMIVNVSNQSGGSTTFATWGIGTTTGASGAGLITGENSGDMTFKTALTAAGDDFTGVVPPYRIKVSVSTSYYPKIFMVYTGTAPKFVGRMSARRVR